MAHTRSAVANQPISFINELLASVVVFLVALPLCIGIAVASGVPAERGLVTGIVGGVIVGFISGQPLQVSGPAAGLLTVVLAIKHDHGLAALGVIVLIAGAIQLAAGFLRLGRWFRAVSPAVIYGMLAGIGVLIFSSQFHRMVDDVPKSSGLENIIQIPGSLWKAVGPGGSPGHRMAAAIGVLTLVILVGWNKVRPAFLKSVPGQLIAVVVAAAAAALLGLPVLKVTVPESLAAAVQLPTQESWGLLVSREIWVLGVTMAVVASAETLLCATAVDRMQDGPRTDYDKELRGQGIGNIICGVLGALPMTGVIVRSSANVEAGARTRWSAILHGLWLLALVAAVPGVLRLVPTSALAAILVYTGCRLVNLDNIRKLATYGRGEVMVYAITVGVIVFEGLLEGVVVGIVLAVVKMVYQFTYVDVRVDHEPETRQYRLHISGAPTFLRLPYVAATLDAIPRSVKLQVDATALRYVDPAIIELFQDWGKQAESQGGHLDIDYGLLRQRFEEPKGIGPRSVRPPPPKDPTRGPPPCAAESA